MGVDFSEQRASLEREIQRMEALLSADENWRALQAIEATIADGGDAAGSARDHLQERSRLQRALQSNRLYCARARLMEAIHLIDDEMRQAETDSASAPDLFNDREDKQTVEVLPKSAALPAASKDETSQGTSTGALNEAFRTRVKVKIHAVPPGAPPSGATAAILPSDDLTQIRGIDANCATQLKALGVHRFEQIAAWRTHDVRAVRAALGLDNLISRANWIEQAALIAVREGREVAPLAPEPGLSSKAFTDKTSAVIEPVDPVGETRNDTAAPTPQDGAVLPLSRPAVAGLVATAAGAIAARLTPRVLDPQQLLPTPEPTSHTNTGAARLPRVEADQPAARPAQSLRRIRSIDADLERALNGHGVSRYEQIAAWRRADLASLSAALGLSPRQVNREGWIEQAAILATGHATDFARLEKAGAGSHVAPTLPDHPLLPDAAARLRLAERSQAHVAIPPVVKDGAVEVDKAADLLTRADADAAAGADVAAGVEAASGADAAARVELVSTQEADLSPQPADAGTLDEAETTGSKMDRTDLTLVEPQATTAAAVVGAAAAVSKTSTSAPEEPAPCQPAQADEGSASDEPSPARSAVADDDGTDIEPEMADAGAAGDPGTLGSDATQSDAIGATDAIVAIEAEVELVPRNSQVGSANSQGGDVTEPDAADQSDQAPPTDPGRPRLGFLAPRPERRKPAWTEEDDIPLADQVAVEEASVEILPTASPSPCSPREHDDPVPMAPPASLITDADRAAVGSSAKPETPKRKSETPMSMVSKPAGQHAGEKAEPKTVPEAPSEAKPQVPDGHKVGRFLKALHGD